MQAINAGVVASANVMDCRAFATVMFRTMLSDCFIPTPATELVTIKSPAAIFPDSPQTYTWPSPTALAAQ